MDKTYAETQGEKPFDWNLFLVNPPENGSPEHISAIGRARMWTTCACGNQCAIIPRRESTEDDLNGAPFNQELRNLGYDFYHWVKRAKWSEALRVLAQIEARSTVLIAEELANLQAAV